jgi:hypothetical protein
MIREQREELERIHRAHLWNRLKERVKHAQVDPSLLALLAREAFELGFSLPSFSEPKTDSPAEQPQDGNHHHRRW